jgi:hypothetical protein
MPTSPTFPSMPMPRNELEALHSFCMVAKQAIEQLQGADRATGYAPRMFVQDQPPTIERDGDFWLAQGTSTTLNVSLAGQWVRAGTLV